LNETADVNRPLIDQVLPISELRAEYERGSPAFVKQIDWLKERGFEKIRRARGEVTLSLRTLGVDSLLSQAMEIVSTELFPLLMLNVSSNLLILPLP